MIKNKFSNAYKYPVITINKKQYRVNRVMAETFIPNPENKPCVCHSDDNPQNNAVSNLWWGTHKENSIDMALKGRNYTASINQESIKRQITILEFKKSGLTSREIGESLNMTTNAINAALHRLRKRRYTIETLQGMLVGDDYKINPPPPKKEELVRVTFHLSKKTAKWLDSIDSRARAETIRKAVSFYQSIHEDVKSTL